MGACELESGDVALAAIPIRKMTIGIAQTLLLIIDWRIAMPKRTTGDRPELKPVNVRAAAIDIGSKMHMAAVNPASTDVPVRSFGTFTQDLHGGSFTHRTAIGGLADGHLGAAAWRAGLIHHSDRGVQYASAEYRQVMRSAGLRASMSRKGDCYDKAPMESFFHTLKTELVHHTHYATRGEATRDIFAYIEGFYNRTRRHSAIGYISPIQMELKAA
jgi:transposase InsO family protein